MKTDTTPCDSQSGSLKERHVREDGTVIFLPVGAKLYPRLDPTKPLPKGWEKEPLGGTYG